MDSKGIKAEGENEKKQRNIYEVESKVDTKEKGKSSQQKKNVGSGKKTRGPRIVPKSMRTALLESMHQ